MFFEKITPYLSEKSNPYLSDKANPYIKKNYKLPTLTDRT